MSEHACPCGHGQYSSCCQPLHLGQLHATSAEQLMRSRYSAFAKQQIDYVLHTTAIGQQAALDKVAIRDWSQANQWLKLELLPNPLKLDKQHAQVAFKAHYHDGTAMQLHQEVSYFVLHADRWYFLDPTTELKTSMKQPCVCGSGKKFKQCCARYL